MHRAKLRWRIERDYRELKHGRGLDHFEGRSWPDRHHHVPLDRCPRLPHRAATLPKSEHVGLTLYRVLDLLQDVLKCWTCTTCNRPPPAQKTISTQTAAGSGQLTPTGRNAVWQARCRALATGRIPQAWTRIKE